LALANPQYTSYPVIGDPPLFAGAFQLKYTCWFCGVAVKFCGAVGIVTGVAAAVLDAVPVPAAFTA
jgi:hypothetical protein